MKSKMFNPLLLISLLALCAVGGFSAITGWHIPDLFRGEIEVAKFVCTQTGQEFRFTQAAGGDIDYSWTLWRRLNEKEKWATLANLAADNPRLASNDVQLSYDPVTDVLDYRLMQHPGAYFIFDGTHTQTLQADLFVCLTVRCPATAQQFMVARPLLQRSGDQMHGIWYQASATSRWLKISEMNLVNWGPAPSISYAASTDVLSFTMGGVSHELFFDGTHTGHLK